MKIAALGDIHVRNVETVAYTQILKQASDGADVLLLAGDLTHAGLPEEAHALRRILDEINKPAVAVLGNHDYDTGHEREISEILTSPLIHVLNGDYVVVNGVGFAGIKGFAGGFGSNMLPKFGEGLLKEVVDRGANEALLLEHALAELDTKTKIALLHYSPVRETVVGEAQEIFPFLGLTRLEEPLDRFKVTMAFHGHAHHGTYEGKTAGGVPVYNVALPVLEKLRLPASFHELA